MVPPYRKYQSRTTVHTASRYAPKSCVHQSCIHVAQNALGELIVNNPYGTQVQRPQNWRVSAVLPTFYEGCVLFGVQLSRCWPRAVHLFSVHLGHTPYFFSSLSCFAWSRCCNNQPQFDIFPSYVANGLFTLVACVVNRGSGSGCRSS